MSLATGLVALGSTQLTALPLNATYNAVATTAASTGVILRPDLEIGEEVFVRNGGANTLNIYPAYNYAINGGTVNAAITLAAAAAVRLVSNGAGGFWQA